MKMLMQCPKCNKDIDFMKQVMYLFDYHTGESEFDPKYGVMFHEIQCDNPDCDAHWILTLSGVQINE